MIKYNFTYHKCMGNTVKKKTSEGMEDYLQPGNIIADLSLVQTAE